MALDTKNGPVSAELLALLRCPETRQPLQSAGAELLAQLEFARNAGELRNRAGAVVAQRIEHALVRQDGKRVYPVLSEIPVLIAGEGIDI